MANLLLFPDLRNSTTQRKIVNLKDAPAWQFTTAWTILCIGEDVDGFSAELIQEVRRGSLNTGNHWLTFAVTVTVLPSDGSVTLTVHYLLSCSACSGYGNYRCQTLWRKEIRASIDFVHSI